MKHAPDPNGLGPTSGQFTLPLAAEALAFTGERMTTAMHGQVAFEHFHRYCLARDLCAGRDVLDIASGEGYGSAFLATAARSVLGVEIDPDSVAHAAASYARDNLEFRQGDALDIPVPDASVDVVVSFETLEHLPDQTRFLQQIRRVLRPGGLLIVSSPDRAVYSAPGQPANRFHVLELTRAEFAALLDRHFAHHRILAQRAVIGSVVAADDTPGWRSFDRRSHDIIEAMPGLSRAPYLIALASDADIPALPSSAYLENHSIDHLLDAPRISSSLRAELAAARDGFEAALAAARQDTLRQREEDEAVMADLRTAIAELERATAERHAAFQRRERELEDALHVIRSSTLWRLGGPLRRAGRRFPWLVRQARRVARLGWWTLQGRLLQRLRERREILARLRQPGLPPRAPIRAELGLPPAHPAPVASALALPTSGAPVLTILIPTYGQVDYTLRCLATLAAHPPAVPFEVLVVDDASADPRLPDLRQVQGIRLTERADNLGFLRSCNAAALDARGQFLFLLNNDTEVMPGALDALLHTFRDHPQAGLVGARLLYPDGWQQEAGGIVWDDASAWNYGNRDDPRRPEYGYLRDADYISGAAIMIPTPLWRELGGFDELFVPAYCEDSDLAFRIRAAGRRVLYQPAALVIHHEGVSHGTDTAHGLKAHQVANQIKLRQRWAGTLAQDHLPPGQRVLRARDRARHRKVTLVLDNNVPEPDRDAGSRTMVAFMDALLAAGRVVKFWPLNGLALPGYTEALQQKGIEVLFGPWSGSFAAWIAEHGAEIDEVLLSRPHVAADTMALLRKHSNATVLFYGHDLHHARFRQEARATRRPELLAEAARAERLERQAWRAADLTLYPSEEEAAAVRAMEPGIRVRAVTPYALLPRARPPVPGDRRGLLFVAGFGHPPNEDAAAWLVREILPRLLGRHPELTLALVGSKPTALVQALAGPGIEVTGFVTDAELARRYAAARVVVCPLRFGAGVKMKVVEALNEGVPLVTTSVGAQGLDGLEGVAEIADDPALFADAVHRLLVDDGLWAARAAAEQRYAQASFSPAAMQRSLSESFAEAAERPERRSPTP